MSFYTTLVVKNVQTEKIIKNLRINFRLNIMVFIVRNRCGTDNSSLFDHSATRERHRCIDGPWTKCLSFLLFFFSLRKLRTKINLSYYFCNR